MKKSPILRIRLAYNLGPSSIGFGRLYNELMAIQSKHQDDPSLAASEQRSHLIQMWHDYCNGGFKHSTHEASFITPLQIPQIAMQEQEQTSELAVTSAVIDEAEVRNSPSTPMQPPQTENSDANDDLAGVKKLRLENGSLKFGEFILE